MMLNVRLDSQLEYQLDWAAQFLRQSKSKIVKDILRAHLPAMQPPQTAWAVYENLVGSQALTDTSGRSDRSTQRKAILRDKIHAAHARQD